MQTIDCKENWFDLFWIDFCTHTCIHRLLGSNLHIHFAWGWRWEVMSQQSDQRRKQGTYKNGQSSVHHSGIRQVWIITFPSSYLSVILVMKIITVTLRDFNFHCFSSQKWKRWCISALYLLLTQIFCQENRLHRNALKLNSFIYCVCRPVCRRLQTSLPVCLWAEELGWSAELLQRQIHRPGYYRRHAGCADAEQHSRFKQNDHHGIRQCKLFFWLFFVTVGL